MFLLHDLEGSENILRHWKHPLQRLYRWQPLPALAQYLTEGSHHTYDMLWPILTYFGEKRALYVAWTHFYTSYMIFAAGPCLVMEIVLSVSDDMALLPPFAIMMCLWTSVLVERWKRKRSELLCNWGIPKNREPSGLWPDFHGDFVVDTATNEVHTIYYRSIDISVDRRNRECHGPSQYLPYFCLLLLLLLIDPTMTSWKCAFLPCYNCFVSMLVSRPYFFLQHS
jgi:hypothetical protein